MSGIGMGAILINEVELNPPGDANEWVELYNTDDEDLDIGRWSIWIVDVSDPKHWTGVVPVPKGTVIQAEGFYVAEGDPRWVHENNGTVILKNNAGLEIDKTHYMIDDLNNGFTWSRFPDGKDTDQRSDWAFIKSTKNAQNMPNGTFSAIIIDSGGDSGAD